MVVNDGLPHAINSPRLQLQNSFQPNGLQRIDTLWHTKLADEVLWETSIYASRYRRSLTIKDSAR